MLSKLKINQGDLENVLLIISTGAAGRKMEKMKEDRMLKLEEKKFPKERA